MSILALTLFVLLSTVAASAVAYAFLQPRIAAEKNAEARLNQFKRAETDSTSKRVARDRIQEVAKRRKTIQNSLQQIEDKQKERSQQNAKPSLQRRLEQAGLKISERQYLIMSVCAGLVLGLLGLLLQPSLIAALGIAIVGGLGLPRWTLNYLRGRRQKKFIAEFPNAVDLIVRGVKSGLPLNDTFRMIASEAAEPVRSEFQKIVEAQQMGMTVSESVERLYQSIPLAETNFFAIVIMIQSQAGGNLSEALGNLSRVLRDRKKMKAKIQAMAMEAKASGGIIGALPFIVAALVYLTTPDYISLLFTNTIGNIILIVAGFWMTIGIVVMKKMINFDF
ncbi:pilus assembly protein [Aureimonas sp. SA4125]|uniref:type II secretion system F family protein n=1 Tax=Aureimonas sp. SA4125 TaxID=2826993 RepID=UPI001CC3FC45|nr:type II secretion system F family protein [Aureimonas sp. SA4125]BDA82654.1 pilus assembly protein [Aureimonas sp. SA4125]